MKEEKFKVINFIRELVLTIDKELENYPKKDIEIKNRIRTSTYDLLELAHEANSSLLIDYKIQMLTKMLAKIKILDFLLNLSYDKKLITEKKYFKLASKLDDMEMGTVEMEMGTVPIST